MSMNRIALRTLAAATALTAFAAPAYAQQIDTIYSFGDSYADTGNAFAYGYANPTALQTYPTGRFSGGTVYVDTLKRLLNADLNSYAIGGALASQNNTLICFDPTYGAPLCGRGFQFQADQYSANGSGANSQNDLITVSIGGNDARLYQQAGGPLAFAAATDTQTAAAAAATLDQIVGSGTPTISFLYGDTGTLPEIAGNSSAQEIRSAYSNAFATGIRQTLAGYASRGSIVHYLDGVAVAANIAANPGAYGFTSTGPCPATNATQCVTDDEYANQFLFYVDALHLTSAGFAVIAQYIDAQLTAPQTLNGSVETALEGASSFGRVLTNRMDLASPRDGDMPEGIRFWATGDTYQMSADDNGITMDHKVSGYRGTIGADYGFGMGAIGIAAGLGRGKNKFGNNEAESENETIDLGVYGSVGFAGVFAQAYASMGMDEHEVMRAGVQLPMSAEFDGDHKAAGLKAGYLMNAFGGRIGPVVAFDYASAETDAYTESGDPALNLMVGEIENDTLHGSLGLEMRGDILASGLQLRPFFSAVIEKNLDGHSHDVTFSQTSSPEIVNTYDLGSYSTNAFARFSAGLRTSFVGKLAISGAVSMTSGRDDGEQATAQIGLSMPF